MKSLTGRVLVEGSASGNVLVLDESLSFWGGFDPQEGKIIDIHHPQTETLVGNHILIIPSSRGSAGTPACIAETLRNGSGPLAFILGVADVNICVGVSVANHLYGSAVPVIEVGRESLSLFDKVKPVRIDVNGLIEQS